MWDSWIRSCLELVPLFCGKGKPGQSLFWRSPKKKASICLARTPKNTFRRLNKVAKTGFNILKHCSAPRRLLSGTPRQTCASNITQCVGSCTLRQTIQVKQGDMVKHWQAGRHQHKHPYMYWAVLRSPGKSLTFGDLHAARLACRPVH